MNNDPALPRTRRDPEDYKMQRWVYRQTKKYKDKYCTPEYKEQRRLREQMPAFKEARNLRLAAKRLAAKESNQNSQ